MTATYAYEVSPNNPYYAVYDNALYTKDFSTLAAVPTQKENLLLHPGVKTIGRSAFHSYEARTPVILPWGTARVEDEAFSYMYSRPVVILPDTLTFMGQQFIPHASETLPVFFFSPGNPAAQSLDGLGVSGEIQQNLLPESLKGATTIQEIYKRVENSAAAPSGWVKEGGKWYYYLNGKKATGWQMVGPTWYYMDANGVMQTGWITSSGSQYFLRDWGGMAANGWYQIGGKWYYFNSWGGMVKNSWIYGLDKKWYYVGSDGAMLTNTRTPDGFWVNASGVWVR